MKIGLLRATDENSSLPFLSNKFSSTFLGTRYSQRKTNPTAQIEVPYNF